MVRVSFFLFFLDMIYSIYIHIHALFERKRIFVRLIDEFVMLVFLFSHN